MFKKLLPVLFLYLPTLVGAQNKLPGNMYKRTLSNGLEVLVVEDKTVPLATMVMTFKTGSYTETENTNGLTGIYLNMLPKNNIDYPDYGFNSGGLGISSRNTSTTAEYARFFFTLPKTNMEEGFNFMNATIRKARLDPRELEKQKEVDNNQLKQKQSNPSFVIDEAMRQHLWGNLNYRKNPMGTEEIIMNATKSSLDVIKQKYFNPDNALLIVGGAVSHDTVFNMAEKKFGDWEPGNFDPFKKWPIPEFKPLEKSDFFIVESPLAKSPYILLQWQGPDTRNDIQSTYTADVFSDIVNQKSSKLKTALLQSGLASAVNFNYLTLKHVGPISLYVIPNPAKIKECVAEIKKQIGLMADDNYFTDTQVETAKRLLEIKKIREEDITSDFVQTLSFWWASASLNYYMSYNDDLMKVSRKDIKTYLNKYIINKAFCAGLLIDPELNKQINAVSFFKANN